MTPNPKKISVRPGNELEGGGIIVWVYHRKVQIQLSFYEGFEPEEAITQAVEAWQHAMRKLEYNGF